MIDRIDWTGSARRGAGPSGPEGADVCVVVVLSVLKVPTRASVDVPWSFENVVGWKQGWGGLREGP